MMFYFSASCYSYMNNPFMGGHHCRCRHNNPFNTMMRYGVMMSFINNMFAPRRNYLPAQQPVFMQPMPQAYPMPSSVFAFAQPYVMPGMTYLYRQTADNSYNMNCYNIFNSIINKSETSKPEASKSKASKAKTPKKETPTPKGKGKVLPKTEYVRIAREKAKQYGVDERLVLAVIDAESGFVNNQTSHAGAKGLMQLMPKTAENLGVTDPMDPVQNIDGGVRLLRDLLKQFNGNIKLALAAYNAGPAAVKKHKGIPPFKETQEYVDKIYNNYQNYSVA